MAPKTKLRGFTLIEMVIVIVVLLILIATATTVLVQEFQIFYVGQNIVNADWQGRIALDRMVRDIRDTSEIVAANSNSLTFKDFSGNIITYKLTGNKLVYSGTSGDSDLADNINTLTFNYYDQDAGSIGKTRYITITLNVVNMNVNFNLNTAVYLWNIN